MATVYTKDESLAAFVERAKAENQKELDEVLEFQRILDEIIGEVERPQIYQIKVRSNW